MNYTQSLNFVNSCIEKIENQLSRSSCSSRPVFCMLGGTSTDEADGKPGADAQSLERGHGLSSVRTLCPPGTNRGVESSQSEQRDLKKRLEWEDRRAAVSTDGTMYYGGVDGQSEVVLFGSALPPSLIAKLDEYAGQAKELHKPVSVEIAGMPGRLSAAPRGNVGYSWAFDCGGLRLLLHRSPCDSIPVCKLILGFHAVDQLPAALIVRWVKCYLGKLGVKVERDHIRRLDIQITAACTITDYASAGVGNRYITYQQKKQTQEDNGRVQSITWGRHDSPISFKIYDKTAELFDGGDVAKLDAVTGRFSESEDSAWLGNLTRYEFSMNRDFLKMFEINTFEDFDEKRLALVDYLTYNWFRMTETAPDREHKHQSRCRTAGFWLRVQEMFRTVFNSPVATFSRPKKEVSALLTDQKREATWQTTAGYLAKLLADDVITAGPAQGEKTITETLCRMSKKYCCLIPRKFCERMLDKALEKIRDYLAERTSRSLPLELLAEVQ